MILGLFENLYSARELANTSAHSHGRAAFPVSGVPEGFHAAAEPLEAHEDAHRGEALPVPRLQQVLHAAGELIKARKNSYGSVGRSVWAASGNAFRTGER